MFLLSAINNAPIVNTLLEDGDGSDSVLLIQLKQKKHIQW